MNRAELADAREQKWYRPPVPMTDDQFRELSRLHIHTAREMMKHKARQDETVRRLELEVK